MKKRSKFLSVILAAFLLLQTFSMICFAETTSNLPTNLVWSSEKKGYFQFTIPDHITDRYNYRINLYKNGEYLDWTQSSVHLTEFEDSRVYSRSYLTDYIIEGGSGTYTYTVTIGNETTEESEPFEYTEPADTLPVPQNVVLLDGQVRWTPVVSEYCSGYMVEYYVGYPDGTIDFFYGEGETPATADYQDYTQDNDVPYYYNDQVNRRYEANPTKYPKESAFMMAAVKAVSSDIFMTKDSEFSEPVAMSEDTETEFCFNLPNITLEKGEAALWSDMQEYVPERMRFGLIYASNVYEEYIANPATVTFTKDGAERTVTLDSVPLLTENGAAWYDLEFPVPSDLAAGTYQAVIHLAIATAKDAPDVKPYVITTEITINPSYLADFIINDGVDMATDKNLTLSFNVDGYTKYKVNDGEYTAIPANNTDRKSVV